MPNPTRNNIDNAGAHIYLADEIIKRLGSGLSIVDAMLTAEQYTFDSVDLQSYTTAKTYLTIGNRLTLMTKEQISMFLSQSTKPGEYYKNRAAIKFAIAYATLENDLALVERLTRGYIQHSKPESFKRRKSKATDNRTIVEDWREQFVAKLNASDSKYRTHAALCLLTGMRPHEFAPDLGATVYYSSTELVVEIEGAKVKFDQNGKEVLVGMPTRRISFALPNDDVAIQILLNAKPVDEFKLQVCFDESNTLESNKTGLANLVQSCDRDLLGKYKSGDRKGQAKRFTVYNLRHMFASALKASDMSYIDISRALGHVSEKTKMYYGRCNAPHSKGVVVPSKVASSHTPRPIKAKMPRRVATATGATTAKRSGMRPR